MPILIPKPQSPMNETYQKEPMEGPFMKRMSHITRLCNTVATIVLLNSCGSLTSTTTSSFKIRMQGIYGTPVGATGTTAPQSETFLFKNVNLTKTDGTAVSLYSSDPATYKIIDRPQLLYANYDMSEYDGEAFSKATVVFDNTVVVTTKTGNEINLALDSGTLELVQSFTIDKQQSQTLTIKASWGKTITVPEDSGTETAVAPTFTMTYSSD